MICESLDDAVPVAFLDAVLTVLCPSTEMYVYRVPSKLELAIDDRVEKVVE